MRRNIIIGGGMAGRFLAYLYESIDCEVTILHDEEKKNTNPLLGEFYKGKYGGLANWGGQLFLDYSHPVFSIYRRSEIINLVSSFLSDNSQYYSSYQNEHGFGFLLPKNWHPNRSYRCKHANVSEIDLVAKKLFFVEGQSMIFDKLAICTGAQRQFGVKSDKITLTNVPTCNLYDKTLYFKNAPKDWPAHTQPSTTVNGGVFQHRYPLTANVNYDTQNSNLIRLMHYMNNVIPFTSLTFKDLFVGANILIKKPLKNNETYGFICTDSPINGRGKKFDDILSSGSGTALHFNVFQVPKALKILNDNAIITDAHKSNGVSIRCGNVGYRLLNVLEDWIYHEKANFDGCKL